MLGLGWGMPVHAETDAIDVQPNVYEEQKIKIEKNIISKDEQKKPLPEEQRNLTFEAPAESIDDRITDHLFLAPSNETNTILTKASQLNLFSEKEKKVQRATEPNQTETEESSSLLLLMFAGLVLVIATMFFFIIPKFMQTRH